MMRCRATRRCCPSTPTRARQEANHAEVRELAHVLDGGAATRADIDAYYGFKQTHYRGRIELIEFILSEPFWDADTHARYRRSLATAELELAKIQHQHALALRK